MGELTKLPNIAAKLESQLAEAGITTVDELRRIHRSLPGRRGRIIPLFCPAGWAKRRWGRWSLRHFDLDIVSTS